jgi:23S rRNA pseudouridine1911/1915/1917 synthase
VKPAASEARFRATAADQGHRLDQVITGHLQTESRARVQALIGEGQVLVDGAAQKASYRVRGTEEVLVRVPAPISATPAAEALPLTVVHQDQDIVVVDKAAGMVVHPGAGHRDGTLVNALLHHVKDLAGVGGELRPGIVHRLDRDTSGLLVIAKSDRSLRALQAAFKDQTVEKVYLALVAGTPAPVGTFRTLYGRNPRNRLKFSSRVKRGKAAVTHFKVLEQFPAAALVEVRLETGRTHQIRVHFADHGTPVLSDPLYGTRKSRRPEIIARQALHATRLTLPHPRTGKRLTFEAPVPKDFARAQKLLKAERP